MWYVLPSRSNTIRLYQNEQQWGMYCLKVHSSPACSANLSYFQDACRYKGDGMVVGYGSLGLCLFSEVHRVRNFCIMFCEYQQIRTSWCAAHLVHSVNPKLKNARIKKCFKIADMSFSTMYLPAIDGTCISDQCIIAPRSSIRIASAWWHCAVAPFFLSQVRIFLIKFLTFLALAGQCYDFETHTHSC